jgi:hypothetical protein
MPSAISRLRALVHCVLRCSLLTTWLCQPVDVVASLGHTWLSCVCIPDDGASCQLDRGGIRGALRMQCVSSKFPSKVCEVKSVECFCFCVFAIRNNSICLFCFFRFFDSADAAPPSPAEECLKQPETHALKYLPQTVVRAMPLQPKIRAVCVASFYFTL